MQIISIHQPQYPHSLRFLKPSLYRFYAEGDVALLSKDSLAVVGSRHHTPWGEYVTKEFIKAFVQHGLVIVSGMAKGIDSIAHESCIRYGGKTIAVLGCGLEAIPEEKKPLYDSILEHGGCVMSEYPPDEPSYSSHFPARNRIVSGLCKAVWVVEAAYRSGTSITARLAMEQRKTVYCLPQERECTKGIGTNHLLQNGAKLILSPQEVLSDLGVLKNTVPPVSIQEHFPPEEQAILTELLKGNRNPTALSLSLHKPIFQIQSLLMRMELKGILEKNRKGEWVRSV